MAAISLNPTIWGATRTTTFTTSTTATPGEIIYISFPTLTTSQVLEYTTLPSPTSPNSKWFPDGQPILILTQVNGVIVNPQGQTLSTATVVQSPPPLYPTLPPGDKIQLVQPSYHWANWSTGEKAGVIVASVAVGIGLIGAIWYVCVQRRKRNRLERDMERGPNGGRGARKKGKVSRGSGAGAEAGPRGIEGIENVEMGPAARRSIVGDPSSAPARRRSGEVRGERRSRRQEGNREPGLGAEVPEVVSLPVGQRPLHPRNAQPTRRAGPREPEPDNEAGPSVIPVRRDNDDASDSDMRLYNFVHWACAINQTCAILLKFVVESLNSWQEDVYPQPPPRSSKAARKRSGID
ncbi:hypothetical protein MMC16_003766 [Acarospora aff. strigata]|nr:hypothetical protein [Acarospora aff. strigata]